MGVEWLRSSACGSLGNCVEARRAGAVVLVQDSKLPASGGGVMQAWTVPEWSGLVSAIKAKAAHPAVDVLPTGTVWLGFQHSGRHEILRFTPDEWSAFVAGVVAGEFDFDKLSGPAAAKGLATAGQAGAPTADGAGQVATGAGAGNRPAPVAAEVLGPLPVKPGAFPLAVQARPGHDPTQDGESCLPGAAHTHFSGPNVASMNVPAGRDPSGGSTSPGATGAIATTGQPGPDFFSADQVEVDYLAEVITEAHAQGFGSASGGYELARYILAVGYRRDVVPPAVVESWRDAAASALKWGSGPLVEHVTESSRGDGTAEATGGAPPDRVGVSGGKAGPGLTPVSPGPAERTGGVS